MLNILKPASKTNVLEGAEEWKILIKERECKDVLTSEALGHMFWNELNRFFLPAIAMLLSWLMAYATNDLRADQKIVDTVLSSPFVPAVFLIFAVILTANRMIFAYRLMIISSLKSNLSAREE